MKLTTCLIQSNNNELNLNSFEKKQQKLLSDIFNELVRFIYVYHQNNSNKI